MLAPQPLDAYSLRTLPIGMLWLTILQEFENRTNKLTKILFKYARYVSKLNILPDTELRLTGIRLKKRAFLLLPF
jgi:hypothetical protein